MSGLDVMVLPAPSRPAPGASETAVAAGQLPASILFLHLEGGRWHRQPPYDPFALPEALALVESNLDQVAGELDEPAPEGYLVALQEAMSGLFQAVVPPELRVRLEAVAVASAAANESAVLRLHLAPELDAIPWELMHDGTGFLGLRFVIARLPLVAGGPRPNNGSPRRISRVVSALGRDVLKGAERTAWSKTFAQLLSPPVEVVRRPEVDEWPSLPELMKTPADVLYITCHGLTNERGEVYWSLNDAKPGVINLAIRPRTAGTLRLDQREPLVFGNACHPTGGALSTRRVASAGFGFEFFSYGASAFVGTFAPITKRLAPVFATRFFERALGQQMGVGEALWSTKNSFLDEGEPDPSWLFYALYGDPETQFAAAV